MIAEEFRHDAELNVLSRPTTTEHARLGFAPVNGASTSSGLPQIVALSVVVPVHNEEPNLPALFARLLAVLDRLGQTYEIVFTNDGSVDRSLDLLRAQFAARPDVIRVIDFNANYGQHMAIMAAFERIRGEVVVTLDADLQNPPEEIPKLLAAIEGRLDRGRRIEIDDLVVGGLELLPDPASSFLQVRSSSALY